MSTYPAWIGSRTRPSSVRPFARCGSDRPRDPAGTEAMNVVRADADGERVTAAWLQRGGVAVVPTDTVYGLAARPAEEAAVRTIYRLKGRPEGMHLPVLAATVDQVRGLGVAFTSGADELARR